MSRLPPPPVPSRLLELLKDYPGHIERVKEVLDDFAEPKLRLQPFDEAVWALQDRLYSFVLEADDELEVAVSNNDANEIEKAKAKLDLMFLAHSRNVGLGGRSLSELCEYFKRNKEAFE